MAVLKESNSPSSSCLMVDQSENRSTIYGDSRNSGKPFSRWRLHTIYLPIPQNGLINNGYYVGKPNGRSATVRGWRRRGRETSSPPSFVFVRQDCQLQHDHVVNLYTAVSAQKTEIVSSPLKRPRRRGRRGGLDVFLAAPPHVAAALVRSDVGRALGHCPKCEGG